MLCHPHLPPDDGDAGGVGGIDHGLSVHEQRLARIHRQRRRADVAQHVNCAHADDGNIEAHVLIRLGDLHQPYAGAGQLPGAAQHLVGALHRLDRDDRAVFHRHGLADIEGGDGVGHAVAELRRRPAPRPTVARAVERAGPGQQRLQQFGRVDERDAVVGQHVGDGGNQRVGVPRLQARAAPRAASGRAGCREKILTCLTCPAITARRDPGGLQHLDARAELAERHPVQVRSRLARGGVGQIGEGLFLHRDDGDLIPLRAGRVEDEKREPAVAGDDASASFDGCDYFGNAHPQVSTRPATISSVRRVGRRRMTPRCELRMNCTRYATSGHTRASSCSISRRARLVLRRLTSR